MKRKNQEEEIFTKIKVLGIGGAGGNIVGRLVGDKIKGVELAALNTDLQALRLLEGLKKIQIGKNLTKGLGSGMNPEIGKMAVEESQKEIQDFLKDTDLVFLTAGLGGGIGSGAIPLIAEMAKNSGILTLAMVTKPFVFEGRKRWEIAEKSLEELKNKVDALITISNDHLLKIVDRNTTILQTFSLADEVLKQGVKGITEIITQPALINVDFADIKNILQDTGQALISFGQGQGEGKVAEAIQKTLSNPLLELSLEGAQGIIFCLTGGDDLTMFEINEAAKMITQQVASTAKIIFGVSLNSQLKEEVKVIVIAANFSEVKKEEKEKREKIIDLSKKPESVEQPKKTDKFSEKEEIFNEEEEKLEIPAFLRKKMGQ